MKHYLAAASLAAALLASGPLYAGEQTVKLMVKGMTCVSCPYQVHAALKEVDGVIKADVSLETRLAVVTYDDNKTKVEDLTEATAFAGFPSEVVTR